MHLLHPDLPAFDPTANSWGQPAPISDVITAFAKAGYDIAKVKNVSEYFLGGNEVSSWKPGDPDLGTEICIVLVGETLDKRWYALEAWNDYTGWGCQDDSDIYFGDTKTDVIVNGLTQEGRVSLDLKLID